MFAEAENILRDASNEFKLPFGANHVTIDESIFDSNKASYHFAESDGCLLAKGDFISEGNAIQRGSQNISPFNKRDPFSHTSVNISSFMRVGSEPLGNFEKTMPSMERPHFGLKSHIETPYTPTTQTFPLYRPDSGVALSMSFHQASKVTPHITRAPHPHTPITEDVRVKFEDLKISSSPSLPSKYLRAKPKSDSIFDFTIPEEFREDFNLKAGKMSTPLVSAYDKNRIKPHHRTPLNCHNGDYNELGHIYDTIRKLERSGKSKSTVDYTNSSSPLKTIEPRGKPKIVNKDIFKSSFEKLDDLRPTDIIQNSPTLHEPRGKDANRTLVDNATERVLVKQRSDQVNDRLRYQEKLNFQETCCVQSQIFTHLSIFNPTQRHFVLSDATCADDNHVGDSHRPSTFQSPFYVENMLHNDHSIIVEPNSETRLKIGFKPQSPGVYEGTLRFKSLETSNSANPAMVENYVSLKASAERASIQVSNDGFIDCGYVEFGQTRAIPLHVINEGSCIVPLGVRLVYQKESPYQFSFDNGESNIGEAAATYGSIKFDRYLLYPGQRLKITVVLHPNNNMSSSHLETIPDFFRVSASCRLFVDITNNHNYELNETFLMAWVGYLQLTLHHDQDQSTRGIELYGPPTSDISDVEGLAPLVFDYPYQNSKAFKLRNLREERLDDVLTIEPLSSSLSVQPLAELFNIYQSPDNGSSLDPSHAGLPTFIPSGSTIYIRLELNCSPTALLHIFSLIPCKQITTTLYARTRCRSILFKIPVTINAPPHPKMMDHNVAEENLLKVPSAKLPNNGSERRPNWQLPPSSLDDFQDSNVSISHVKPDIDFAVPHQFLGYPPFGLANGTESPRVPNQPSPLYEKIGRYVTQMALADIHNSSPPANHNPYPFNRDGTVGIYPNEKFYANPKPKKGSSTAQPLTNAVASSDFPATKDCSTETDPIIAQTDGNRPNAEQSSSKDIIIDQDSLTFKKRVGSCAGERCVRKLRIKNINRTSAIKVVIKGPFPTSDKGFYVKEAFKGITILPHKYVNLPVEFRLGTDGKESRGHLEICDCEGALVKIVELRVR